MPLGQTEAINYRLPEKLGQVNTPKTLRRLFHWNSGLAKLRKEYANGALIVRRGLSHSTKGGQPDSEGNQETAKRDVTGDLDRTPIEKGIGPWVGKYAAFFEEKLYKRAYEKIKSKPGKMRPGKEETLDGITNKWIRETIKRMKDKSFKFKPAERKMIPRIPGSRGFRRLGIPTHKDKLVQEVLRMIMEPIYERKFKETSHGDRPNRSCHTALKEIRK